MRCTIWDVLPPPQLLVLFLFVISYSVNILNARFYLLLLKNEIKRSLFVAYMFCSVVGIIFFFFLLSPLIYWSYFYAKEASFNSRRNAVCAGIAVCFFVHDFPLWWIDAYILLFYGWGSVISSISSILTFLCFVVGFFVTWLGYTRLLCGLLQQHYGTARTTVPPLRY